MRAAAFALVERGISTVLLRPRSKKPFQDDWQHQLPSRERVDREFLPTGTSNLGAILGEPSRHLVDTDLDNLWAVQIAPRFLPNTHLISGRGGRPRSHYFYRAKIAKSRRFKGPRGKTIVELRGTGLQTMVPPSVHPDGDVLEWVEQGEPVEADGAELLTAVEHIAAAALIAEYYPATGSREEYALSLSGFLIRGGVPVDVVQALIAAAADATGDEEAEKRVQAVTDTAAKLAAGEPVTGAPTVVEITGEPGVVTKLTSWLHLKHVKYARTDSSSDDGHGGEEDDEGSPVRGSLTKTLVAIAQQYAELFHDAEGRTYASITVGDHVETHEIKSEAFKRWLGAQLWKLQQRPAGAAMVHAIEAVEAIALYDADSLEHTVAIRLAGSSTELYIDLGDEAWTTLAVTADGWRVVADAPYRFVRATGAAAFPMPVAGGDVMDLRRYVNIATDDEFYLYLACVVMMLLPRGPYTVLVINGEQGSAKSTTSRVTRLLVDPNLSPLRRPPASDEDLMLAAKNSRLVALDNLFNIRQSISDTLCMICTGGGWSTRKFYSNGDEFMVNVQRPVILNGIDELVHRGDLMDRSVSFTLPAIANTERRPEEDFWAAFNADYPALFGALLSAVAGVMRELPGVRLASHPRMADYARVGVALERHLGWPEGSFMRAYAENRDAGTAAVMEGDVLALATRQFMEKHLDGWTGSAALLNGYLIQAATEIGISVHGRDWPKSAALVSRRLVGESAPQLRAHGIVVTRLPKSGKRRERALKLSWIEGYPQGDDAEAGDGRERADQSLTVATSDVAATTPDTTDPMPPDLNWHDILPPVREEAMTAEEFAHAIGMSRSEWVAGYFADARWIANWRLEVVRDADGTERYWRRPAFTLPEDEVEAGDRND